MGGVLNQATAQDIHLKLIRRARQFRRRGYCANTAGSPSPTPIPRYIPFEIPSLYKPRAMADNVRHANPSWPEQYFHIVFP